jgi:hypothetical protein
LTKYLIGDKVIVHRRSTFYLDLAKELVEEKEVNMKPNNKLITTVPVELSSQELSVLKTCLALTISSIIKTQEKARDKISIDPKILEDLYKRLDDLQLKLSKISTPPD